MTIGEQMIKCEDGKKLIEDWGRNFAESIIAGGSGYGLASFEILQIKKPVLALYMQVASWQGMTGTISFDDADKYIPDMMGVVANKAESIIKTEYDWKSRLKDAYDDFCVRIFWVQASEDAMLVWGTGRYTTELGHAYAENGFQNAKREHSRLAGGSMSVR